MPGIDVKGLISYWYHFAIMGADRVTTRNLKVVSVDVEQHLLVLRGAVPGAPQGIVIVRRAVARKPDPKPQPEKAKKGKK